MRAVQIGALSRFASLLTVLLIVSAGIVPAVSLANTSTQSPSTSQTATTTNSARPAISSQPALDQTSQSSTSSVGPLSSSEASTVRAYLDSGQSGYVSNQIQLGGSRYVSVAVENVNAGRAYLSHFDDSTYASAYYEDIRWGVNGITQILVFEETSEGVRLVTDSDTIAKVLQVRTGETWGDDYQAPQIQQWIKDWTNRVLYTPGANVVFGWEKLTRFSSREDAFLASLQGMTSVNRKVKYIPDEMRAKLQNAGSASSAAATATDLADRIKLGEKVKVAGEHVDSRKTKRALEKFADDIKYISKHADKFAYAGSIVSLVLAVSEQQVYSNVKIERLKRIQEYAHNTPGVSLDNDLDGAITRLINMHEDSNQKTAEAISKWIDTSSFDLAATAAPTVAQKFGTWLVTKSSYAASVSTYATSGTAGTLISGAASVAGAGILGWQIGGMLVNREGIYVSMKRAEFSQKAMNQFGKITDQIRSSSTTDITSGGVLQGQRAQTFYSAAYMEKLAQVRAYKYISKSFDSTWIDERLGDVEKLVRLLNNNEYVSDEQAVENTVNRTSEDLRVWANTTIGRVLESYPSQRKTFASISLSTSPSVVTPDGEIWLEATVTNRSGAQVAAEEVSYKIKETGASGSLLGSDGKYSYGVAAPDSSGLYTIVVTATVDGEQFTAKRSIRVSTGTIGVSVGSISGKAFPGGTISQQVTITNDGETSLSDVTFSESGSQASWLSVSSSESDWRPRSQSFESITPDTNDARTVTVTVGVPRSADQGSYSGTVTVTTQSGTSIEIPVSIDVTKQSSRIEQGEESLYDSGTNSWDVFAEVARDDSYTPKWTTDPGHAETIRTNPITVGDTWTTVGTFTAEDVGIENLRKWIATDIDWTEGSNVEEGYLQVRINGESNGETHRIEWSGINTEPRHLDQSQIPTITEGTNTLQFKYVHTEKDSAQINEVTVEPETAKLDTRFWADDADISSDRLSSVKSAALTLDAKAMSDGTAHPMKVYVNGELQGTISAPYGEWKRNQRVTVDPSILSTDTEVEIKTSPSAIYNVDDVELVYSYVKPADIDTDLSSGSISVSKGDQFTISGTVLNDGGKDATNTDFSLSYDNTMLSLISGPTSGDLGTLTPGESARRTWTFKANSGGTTSVSLSGTADESEESASTSVNIETYGVNISAPSLPSTTTNQASVTFQVANTGSVKETIQFATTLTNTPPAWQLSSRPHSVTLAPGAKTAVTVEVSDIQLADDRLGFLQLNATVSATDETTTASTWLQRKPGPDNLAPSIQIDAPDSVTGTNTTVSWTSLDNRDANSQLAYSYRLANHTSWSEWTNTTSTNLSDVPPGTHRFEVRAKDTAGNIGTANTTIRFNRRPTARVTISSTPVRIGQPVVLNASAASDPSGDELSYQWDIDNDGVLDGVTGQTIEHTFTTTGEHTVRLRVSDGTAVDTTTKTIVVSSDDDQPSLQPRLNLTAPTTAAPATVSESGDSIRLAAVLSLNGALSKTDLQSPLTQITQSGQVRIGGEKATISTLEAGNPHRNTSTGRWVVPIQAEIIAPEHSPGKYDLSTRFSYPKDCSGICTMNVPTVTDRVSNAVVYADTQLTATLRANITQPVVGQPVKLTVTNDTSTAALPDALTYDWQFTGPASGEFSQPTDSQGTVEFPVPGTYTITATVTDSTGTTATANTTITVDDPTTTTKPEVTITAPAANAAVTPNTTITATYSDNSRITNVTMTIDGAAVPVTSYANASQLSIPLSALDYSLNEGSHTTTITVVDDEGNKQTRTRSFTVDTDAPTVDIEVNSTTVTPVSPTAMTVRVHGTDLRSATLKIVNESTGVSVYEQSLDPGVRTITWSSITNGSVVPSGAYTALITGTGTTGQTVSDSQSLTVRAEPPTISVATISSANSSAPATTGEVLTTNGTATITGDISAGSSAVTAINITLSAAFVNYDYHTTATLNANGSWIATPDLSNLPDDGTYLVSATATGAHGLQDTATATTTLRLDRQKPTLSARLMPSKGALNTLVVTSSEQLAEQPTVVVNRPAGPSKTVTLTKTSATRWTGTFPLGAPGTYIASVTGQDASGNVGHTTAETAVKTDFSAKNSTVTIGDASTETFIDLYLNTSVNFDQSVYAAVTAMQSSPQLLASNQAGAGFLAGELSPTLSNALSHARIAIPVNESELPARRTPGNLSIHYYNETQGGWQTVPTTIQTLTPPNGSTARQYWVANVTHFSVYGVVATDTTPPELISASPTGTIADTSPTVSFTYADDTSTINASAVEFKLDGESVTANASTSITSEQAAYDASSLSAGTHTASVTVVDTAGHRATFTRSFTIEAADVTSPTIQSVNPTPETTLPAGTSSETLTVSYDDSSGINQSDVRVQFDGATVTAEATITSQKVAYTATGLQNDSTHTFSVRVPDQATDTNVATKTIQFSIAAADSSSSGTGSGTSTPNSGTGSGISGSSAGSSQGGMTTKTTAQEPVQTTLEITSQDSVHVIRMQNPKVGEWVTANLTKQVGNRTVAVTEAKVKAKGDPSKLRLQIYRPVAKSLDNTPPLTTAKPVAYIASDVQAGKRDNVKALRVTLEVAEDVLPANMQPSQVKAYQYTDTGWHPQSTTHLDNGELVVETSNISQLALGIDPANSTTTNQSNNSDTSNNSKTTSTTAMLTTTDRPSKTATRTSTPTNTEPDSNENNKTGTSDAFTDGFGVLVALIGLLIAVSLRRRGHEDQ